MKNIEAWLKSHVALTVIVIGAMAYVFTTFATIDYVDKRHKEVTKWLERVEEKLDRALELKYGYLYNETGKTHN